MEIQYGVCRLSIVSVRKDPTHLSNQLTQLLFGDHYEVLTESKDRKWLHIRTYFAQSVGWIESKQHHSITRDYFEQINSADFKITTDVCSTILYKKTPLSIVMGSIVPISQSELFKMEEQFAFNGEAKSLGQKRDAEFIRNLSMKYLNAPEQEGGRSPFGIDGWGLAQMVFKIAGYHLPANIAMLTTTQQVDSVKVGEIVLMSSSNGSESIGIAVADDKVIHVDGRVKIDVVSGSMVVDAESKMTTNSVQKIFKIIND